MKWFWPGTKPILRACPTMRRRLAEMFAHGRQNMCLSSSNCPQDVISIIMNQPTKGYADGAATLPHTQDLGFVNTESVGVAAYPKPPYQPRFIQLLQLTVASSARRYPKLPPGEGLTPTTTGGRPEQAICGVSLTPPAPYLDPTGASGTTPDSLGRQSA